MHRRDFLAFAALPTGLAALPTRLAAMGQAPAASPRTGGPPVRDAQGPFTFYSPLAEEWYRGGQYFDWRSTTLNNTGRSVRVFHRTFGDRSKPALLLIHGYYRQSFDFREMVQRLQQDYFLCMLDFPGFGFSDKPQDGYSYMIRDDARLLDYYVREVVGLSRFHMFAHDRGNSVAMAFLGDYLDAPRRSYEITYHFVTNGGIFLALANLAQGQRDLLDPVRGPQLIVLMKARPRVTTGTPQQVAEADILAFNDGKGAQLHVGKYQLERAHYEYRWLAVLQASPVPTALLWGLLDTVNPPRLAAHVWHTYLNDRPVESSFWLLPDAGHTLQVEQPAHVTDIVRICLSGRIPPPERENAFMLEIARARTSADAPVYMGRSRIEPVSFPGAVDYSPSGYRY